jgi:HicB family
VLLINGKSVLAELGLNSVLLDRQSAEKAVTGSAQLKLRVSPNLRQRLEKLAQEHGVSINREVEQRLSRSCADDELIEEQPAFQHPAMRGMMNLVATAMLHAGQAKATAFASWLDDPVAYRQAVEAAKAVLIALRPRGAAGMSERQKTFSQLIAEWTLESVANPSNQRLREDLGPALLERIVQSAKSHSSERVEPTMQPSEAEVENLMDARRGGLKP